MVLGETHHFRKPLYIYIHISFTCFSFRIPFSHVQELDLKEGQELEETVRDHHGEFRGSEEIVGLKVPFLKGMMVGQRCWG